MYDLQQVKKQTDSKVWTPHGRIHNQQLNFYVTHDQWYFLTAKTHFPEQQFGKKRKTNNH